MSTPEPAPPSTNGTTNGVLPELVLDISKLHSLPSEQQDLYLLTFVSTLVRHVAGLEKDDVTAQQASIKKELIKILELSSPAPTRVIRNSLGRVFAEVFGKGSRSLLYETVHELLGIINTGKGEKDLKRKHAAVYCLGSIFAAAGDSAISLSSLTCSSILKILKPAQNHAGLRSAVFRALGSVVAGIGSSADEQAVRDIWKQARSFATNDKAVLVQASACRCIEQLITLTPYFDNSNDFDSLKTTIWRVLDSPVPLVRHAGASCLASIMVKAFSEDTEKEPVPRIRKPKKPSRKQGPGAEDEDELERPGSPAPKNPAVQLMLSIPDMLRQLSSQYGRVSTSNKARAGIAICYTQVLTRLDGKIVEEHYNVIAEHFLTEVLTHPHIAYNRYRLLMTRKFIKIILEDTVGSKSLGENGQISAAKWLINGVLKNYPRVIHERREPTKRALTVALSAFAALISSLGTAATALGDSCRDALLQVLQHPSHTVQVHTSHCLRTFVLACPQQLLPSVTMCLGSLKKEIDQLSTPKQSPRRCVGYANGVAAMLSTSRLQPLYGSVDVYSRILSLATELLKTSSSSELRVSATQIQVAWILIGGLMPLGPNFVKIHLPQLLLLWKNALPRPLTKDNVAQRGSLEMSFLAHVRECALGALLVFLDFNSKLVTTDGSTRIATMLQNTILFLDSLPAPRSTEEVSQRLSPSLQMQDFTIMVRRRVLQCFCRLVNLSHLGHGETLSQSNLLSLAISSFADLDPVSPKSLENSIAQSVSNFDSLWGMGDNWGSGVTGLVRGYDVKPLPGEHQRDSSKLSRLVGPSVHGIDHILLSPIGQAREHDSLWLYSLRSDVDEADADPPATEVVNAAITLFATALPLQPPKVQESSLEQMATLLTAHVLQRDPARKAAMTVNISAALFYALKIAGKETQSAPGTLGSVSVEKIIQELLQRFVIDSDSYVRNLGFEALGRLCNISGNVFTSSEVNHLIDTIVANRDPFARAGCAMALGCIHSQVGGMAAGFHLKTIIGVLLSLCSDPHPMVHFWALEGLARVADSAGLTFSGYVSSTLGMLAQLYATDTHNEETASFVTSNIEAEHSTPLVISRCVDSLINVLGPDLQDMDKARGLIFTLVSHFRLEESSAISIESSRCLGHLSLYAPGTMEIPDYVRGLQKDLDSPDQDVRDTATNGLNNLMKRDAELVISTAAPGLEEALWLALDQTPHHEGLQNIFRNWLQQTGLADTALWIQRCQNVLSKLRLKAEEPPPATAAKTATAAVDLQDEEVAGFATAAAGMQSENAETPKAGQEFLKWQTRSFAMSCLSDLLSMVSSELLPDQTIPAEAELQHGIADIVRMAFSASTANVVELRIWGLKLIDQVLKMFGKTPDPDFTEASLLEQYQAQIASALTPAFAADSSPELASEAVNVCATFVATGIVTHVDRMGRIFKLLVTGLGDFSSGSENDAIGDLKGLSYNARVMVKIAVFSAWAQLQIATSEQKYLEAIVQPYAAKLTPLWLESLQEFARLRFEPEISSSGPASSNLDDLYAALNRETLLKFYQDTWLNLVDAVASLVEKDSEFVFDALDGKATEANSSNDETGVKAGNDINYRDEPTAFFFVLFGLAFEALVGQNGSSTSQNLSILEALKRILRPAVSGTAIYQDNVFSETIECLNRLALTEGSATQTVIVEIVRNMILGHPTAKSAQDRNEKLSDDIEQLFELTRIILLVLGDILPNLGATQNPLARPNLTDDAVELVRLCLGSLVAASEVFPSVIRSDLHACIINLFCTILATGSCQVAVIPQAFPIFKQFIQNLSRTDGDESEDDVARLLRGCLMQFLSILSIAQRRERETSLLCAKNTLLAMTILLTTGGHMMPPNDPLIEKALAEILDCLQDLGLAKVAASCLRSLMLMSRKSPTDQTIARILYPHLLLFAVDTSTEDPENVRTLIVHTLTSSIPGLPREKIVPNMAIVIPAVLTRAERDGEEVYPETAARLLEVAAVDQVAFRAILADMTDEQKSLAEGIIRRAGPGRQQVEAEDDETESKPSIALRMDF